MAFSPKTTLTPPNGTSRPPRAGPMIPDKFIWIPPSAIAEGSSSFPTISGIEAEARRLERKADPQQKDADEDHRGGQSA